MKFEAGKTYTSRSICDTGCKFEITVQSRTAQTITTTDGKRLRIFVRDGMEMVKPLGSYSMAPVIRAR